MYRALHAPVDMTSPPALHMCAGPPKLTQDSDVKPASESPKAASTRKKEPQKELVFNDGEGQGLRTAVSETNSATKIETDRGTWPTLFG